MTDLIQRASQAEAAADGSRSITVTASTDEVDRYGDRILVDGVFGGRRYGKGWDLANYLKNPVVCLFHAYNQFPVGTAKVWTDSVGTRKRLRAKITFSSVTGQTVLDLYREGVMRSVSVGFASKDPYRPESGKEREALGLGAYGVLHCNPELWEISAVPLPALPGAVVEGLRGAQGPAEAALILRSLAGSGSSRQTDVARLVEDYDRGFRGAVRDLEAAATEERYQRGVRRAVEDFERGMRRRLT